MVVREGTNVTLVCKARGYPEPYVSGIRKNSISFSFCFWNAIFWLWQVMWRREDGDEMTISGQSGKLFIHPPKCRMYILMRFCDQWINVNSNRNRISFFFFHIFEKFNFFFNLFIQSAWSAKKITRFHLPVNCDHFENLSFEMFGHVYGKDYILLMCLNLFNGKLNVRNWKWNSLEYSNHLFLVLDHSIEWIKLSYRNSIHSRPIILYYYFPVDFRVCLIKLHQLGAYA